MSGPQSPVPKDAPLMVAWDAYKATEEFANSRTWAGIPAHTEGSLWAAFVEGWKAAGGAVWPSAGPSVVSGVRVEDVDELVAEIDRLVAKYRFDAQDVGWLPLSQFAPVFAKLATYARLRGPAAVSPPDIDIQSLAFRLSAAIRSEGNHTDIIAQILRDVQGGVLQDSKVDPGVRPDAPEGKGTRI